MSLLHSLRRSTLAIAAAGLLAGGVVATASTAGAQEGDETPSFPLVALHNDTAEVGTDCPDTERDYWHFVLAPNDGSTTFTAIFLRLATDDGFEDVVVSGDGLIPNGGQLDNVFVSVPEGHELTDLMVLGSQAGYSGRTPNQFNLSHVCVGEDAPEVPPTTEPTPTTDSTTPTTEIPTEVLGTVQTPATDPVPTEVAGAVQVAGELPYTGSRSTGLLVAGTAVTAAGAALVGLARARSRAQQA